MKTLILLLLLSTVAYSQSPVKVSKVQDNYQVSFNGHVGKSVTWTTYGPGSYFTELQSRVITPELRIPIEELANLWIIKGKDTTSVWIINPQKKDYVLTIFVNGRNLKNGETAPRELWDYQSFKEEIENKYSEGDY